MTSEEQMRQEVMRVIHNHMFKCSKCKDLIGDILFHSQETEDVSKIIADMEEMNIKKGKNKDRDNWSV